MASWIFFDNDGVLVETEPLYRDATRAVLAEHGLTLSDAEYVEWFMRQNQGLLHVGRTQGWTAETLADMRARRNALYARMLARAPLAIDGVAEMLEVLHRRARLAIVTSSRREHFEIIHRRTGWLRYFDFVLASGDYTASKPDPAPYLAAVARSGADPAACVVIEDSERGLAAAVAAGLRCVIVPSRLTRGSRFEGAWRVLEGVREVVDVAGL